MFNSFFMGHSEEFRCGTNIASEKLWPGKLERQRPGEAKERAAK